MSSRHTDILMLDQADYIMLGCAMHV